LIRADIDISHFFKKKIAETLTLLEKRSVARSSADAE
jgi:hypothetical protein